MSATTRRYQQARADEQNRLALQLFAQHGRNPQHVAHRDWGDLNRTRRGEPLLPMRQAECGDTSGYKRHLRAGEPVCEACTQAHNRDVQDRAQKAAA